MSLLVVVAAPTMKPISPVGTRDAKGKPRLKAPSSMDHRLPPSKYPLVSSRGLEPAGLHRSQPLSGARAPSGNDSKGARGQRWSQTRRSLSQEIRSTPEENERSSIAKLYYIDWKIPDTRWVSKVPCLTPLGSGRDLSYTSLTIG